MLSVKPLTDTLSYVWRHDPAIDKERYEFVDDVSDDFNKAYTIACETLDFAPLIKEGDKPTTFVFKPLRGSQLRTLTDRIGVNGSPIVFALIFRMCLVRIDNFPDAPKLDKATDSRYPELGAMAKESVIDYFDSLALAMGHEFGCLVTELGALVFTRSTSISGK